MQANRLTNASNLTPQAVAFFAKKTQKTAPTHSAVYAGVMPHEP